MPYLYKYFKVVLLYLLFSLINYINDNYLTTTVEQFIEDFSILKDKLEISPTLAGVTFLAFANGAPDVLTAIIAGQSDSTSTALIPFGSIFGAGLFSTSFILSTVIESQKNEALDIQRRKILIPLIFYIIGIGILIITSLFYHKMNIGIALSLFILYIMYIEFKFQIHFYPITARTPIKEIKKINGGLGYSSHIINKFK